MTATITQLVTSFGMGKTAGQRLLFGGCSAGAVGAMNNVRTGTMLQRVSSPDACAR